MAHLLKILTLARGILGETKVEERGRSMTRGDDLKGTAKQAALSYLWNAQGKILVKAEGASPRTFKSQLGSSHPGHVMARRQFPRNASRIINANQSMS